jgi:rare lipoprotein A
MRVAAALQLTSLSLLALGCASSPRFVVREAPEVVTPSAAFIQDGVASYYAEEFDGRKTSSGETYNMNDLTAAHQTLPFGTIVKVTNKATGKSVTVRINDRGPFLKDRIIDLSRSAAQKIGMIGPGTAEVHLEVLEWGKGN